MSDKVYGFCDAGCRRRVVPYEEFEKSASIIKINPYDEELNNYGIQKDEILTGAINPYILEVGKTYKIRNTGEDLESGYMPANKWSLWRFTVNLKYLYTDPINDPNGIYTDFNSELNYTDGEVTDNENGYLIIRLDSVSFDADGYLRIKYAVNGHQHLTSVMADNDECYVYVSGATEVYLVNESATIEAKDGKSAYEIALDNGFEGTEQEWLAYLSLGVPRLKEELTEEYTEYVDDELAKRGQLKPEFANDISECTDTTKLYVLPDGYIYGYMNSEKYIVENQFVQSEAKYNHRISGGGVVQSGYNGVLVTGLIPITSWTTPYTVKIKGVTIALHSTLQYTVVTQYCDSAGSNIKVMPDCFGYVTTQDTATGIEGNIYNASYTSATHIRFAICIKDNTAITEADTANLFIEFVPKNYNQIVKEWKNTGLAFVPADYEERIIALETDVEDLKEKAKTTPSQSGAVWYAVGDSITKGYGVGADNCWVKYVMQYNGYDAEKSINLGISGLGFAKSDPNYNKTARTVIDENDFSAVDLVTIAIGINDWKEPFSIDTVKSEMRYCFEKIIADNPYCKIIFIAPFNMRNKGSESTNWALGYSGSDVTGGTLQAFIDAQKSVCVEYNIQVIDMTNDSIINKKNINTLLYDGIHPDANCHIALGRELSRRIMFA